MLRKDSCCPAKDASGKSSAVAEERTAKLPSPSEVIFVGRLDLGFELQRKGVSTIRWRIAVPVFNSASTSSTLSVSSAALMRVRQALMRKEGPDRPPP